MPAGGAQTVRSGQVIWGQDYLFIILDLFHYSLQGSQLDICLTDPLIPYLTTTPDGGSGPKSTVLGRAMGPGPLPQPSSSSAGFTDNVRQRVFTKNPNRVVARGLINWRVLGWNTWAAREEPEVGGG